MEFAHIAKRAGAREVTGLERMSQPRGNFDPDLADGLCEATGELGIDLRTRAKVLKIDKNGTGCTVTYETPKDTEVIDCDLVVHATGRVPNIDHLNLDAAGVEYSRRGIKVSPFMRTNNPAIFAAGACADSGPNLTPVAANAGRIAGKNLLAGKDRPEAQTTEIPSHHHLL